MQPRQKPTSSGLLLVFFILLSTVNCQLSTAYAGIRLQGSGQEGLKDSVLIDGTGFGSTPLPGAVSLPGATSLTLQASPPIQPAATAVISAPASTTLTITTSGTHTTVAISPSTPATPPRNNAQLQTCRKSLQLLAETTVAAYTRQPHESYMATLAAATVLDGVITSGAPGDIQPLKKALASLPWRGVLRSEIQQAGKLTQTFCLPTGGWPKTAQVQAR